MLTQANLDLARHPAQKFEPAQRMRMWIRYPSWAHVVQAEATARTATAIRIGFFEPAIKPDREGWVWRSAVTPAAPP